MSRRHDPAPEAGVVECIWCGQKTCFSRSRQHGDVEKYGCISCGRTFWK